MSAAGGVAGAPERWILLGASNLARDFPRVLDLARRRAPAEEGAPAPEVWVAAGHGRSYGTWSRVLVRSLPGIVPCGLWPALAAAEAEAPAPRRALLTDIGNDLVYGASPETIAGWVEHCVEALRPGQTAGTPVTLTLLPLASLRSLSRFHFQVLRSLFFPLHFRSWRETLERAERLQDLLRDLARRRGLATVEPPAGWYGPDRIHLRPGARREAWGELLRPWRSGVPCAADSAPPRLSRPAWWRLTPHRWRLAGVELGRPQPAAELADGTRLHLY